jgi:hypothetical protein
VAAGCEFALVGVLMTTAVDVAVAITPLCGVKTVPVVAACGVPDVATAPGVAGVPPLATVVWAAAVCLANSSIIAIGFSTEAIGETNKPSGIKVGVAAGAEDKDCVQADINIVDTTKMKTTSIPRCFLLIDSPHST